MTSTASKSQIQQVKEWLLAKNKAFSELDHDLDLIENRVIDSLGFMDFVFFLEELVERDLSQYAESVDAFRTLRNIETQILNPQG